MDKTAIVIQEADFDVATEYQALRHTQTHKGTSSPGAIAIFTGLVREFLPTDKHQTLTLEHYPGMAEKVIQQYINDACERWEVGAIRVIHRIGILRPGDQIVFVGASSDHRQAAFSACQFVMDKLKSEAPFWKKENQTWVIAQESDRDAAERWDN